jgi:hypothetical protein
MLGRSKDAAHWYRTRTRRATRPEQGEQIMAARYWHDRGIQPFAEDGHGTAARHDDDAALDAWLASLSVAQFDQIMTFLMDRIYGAPAALDRPVA